MRTGAIALVMLLSACGDARDDYSRTMAADAQRRVGATESDLEDLKRRITTMEERQGATYELAKATYDAHESLRKTFNKNVDIDNRRSDAIDTQLGNCGKQWIQGDQGWVTVNRDCSKLPAKK